MLVPPNLILCKKDKNFLIFLCLNLDILLRVVEKSVKEVNIDGQRSMKAQHEQDIKISEMQSLMTDFDDKIFRMVCQKSELEAALKFAEMSSVLLYEDRGNILTLIM